MAMKIKVWYYVSDFGDGSAGPRFFKTEAECQEAMDAEDYHLTDGGPEYDIFDTDDYEAVGE